MTKTKAWVIKTPLLTIAWNEGGTVSWDGGTFTFSSDNELECDFEGPDHIYESIMDIVFDEDVVTRHCMCVDEHCCGLCMGIEHDYHYSQYLRATPSGAEVLGKPKSDPHEDWRERMQYRVDSRGD